MNTSLCFFFSSYLYTMQNNSIFIIDAGNSSIKVARFTDHQLLEVQRFPSDDLTGIAAFFQENKGEYAISSVLSDEKTKELQTYISGVFLLNPMVKVPLKLNYGTTNTLGMDRLCNAVFAYNHSKTDFAVVVDIGTCIKFDLIHTKDGYLGGSISPGIRLRYKALNDYTGKLPLLSNKSLVDYVGTSTELSIQSGVMNGINAEINEMIRQYRERFVGLTFFMTGGDTQNFDILPKNDIFAVENLTLIGLYEIYQQNA
mgnify:CR=1 FL=1